MKGGELVLPDEIWVADDEAKEIANREIPEVKVVKISNQWLDRIRDYVTEKREIKIARPGRKILYFMEPIRQDWQTPDGSRDPGEVQALKYFIDNIIVLQNKGIIDEDKKIEKILLRKHPSEKREKYVDIIKAVNDRYEVGMDKSECLEDALVWADIAFGCETQALVAL